MKKPGSAWQEGATTNETDGTLVTYTTEGGAFQALKTGDGVENVSPMTGIMEPVITPMREEKPNLIQPTAVVGLGAASASESTSPPPRPGS